MKSLGRYRYKEGGGLGMADTPEMDDELVVTPSELVPVQCEIVPSARVLESCTEEDLAALRKLIAGRIAAMLDTGYEELMAALYRLDISEERAAQAFELREPAAVSDALAGLIIERQLQKIDSRQRRKR